MGRIGQVVGSQVSGQQVIDPKLYQALKELSDAVELFLKFVRIDPVTGQLGLIEAPNSSLLLDLGTQTKLKKALGLPRLTISEKKNISTPSTGALVYELSKAALSFFNDRNWINLGVFGSAYGTVGNAAGTLTTLFSIQLAVSTLDTDGKWIAFRAYGQLANNVNNKTITIVIGSTTVFTYTTAGGPINFVIEGIIIRTGPTGLSCFAEYRSNGLPGPQFTTAVETLENSLPLMLRGNGVAVNDVVGRALVFNLIG